MNTYINLRKFHIAELGLLAALALSKLFPERQHNKFPTRRGGPPLGSNYDRRHVAGKGRLGKGAGVSA